MIDYEKQANQFLESTNTTFKATFKEHGSHFGDEKTKRDIYNIELKRGERVFKLTFGQSMAESGFKVVQTKTGKVLNNLVALQDLPYCKDRKEALRFVNSALSLESLTVSDRQPPTAYDVLVCLQKYDVGTFENFCSEFGYNVDSRKAEKIYIAICNEWDNVQKLWTDAEIEQLREIN
jgi:hypothetical protein